MFRKNISCYVDEKVVAIFCRYGFFFYRGVDEPNRKQYFQYFKIINNYLIYSVRSIGWLLFNRNNHNYKC